MEPPIQPSEALRAPELHDFSEMLQAFATLRALFTATAARLLRFSPVARVKSFESVRESD